MSETDYRICPKCGKKMISRSVPICNYLGRNYRVLGEPIHPYQQIYYWWCGCGHISRHRFESVDPEGEAKKRWEELNREE
ncbi:MAG: hypothetical protein NWE89_12370 [Candidatus Bathyarchaeota archaeon]|nr:hypothetical protein [Candidatus Bathyarchaeota archaeon]